MQAMLLQLRNIFMEGPVPYGAWVAVTTVQVVACHALIRVAHARDDRVIPFSAFDGDIHTVLSHIYRIWKRSLERV